MPTLCDNLKSIAIISSEIESVKERYGRAGSGQFTSKMDVRDENKIFLFITLFPKLIIKKVGALFSNPYH